MAILQNDQVISGGIGVLKMTQAEYLANKEEYDKSGNFIQLTDVNPTVEGSVDWKNVTGKPKNFPPSAHTHIKDEITDFPNMDEKQNKTDNNLTTTNKTVTGAINELDNELQQVNSDLAKLARSPINIYNKYFNADTGYADVSVSDIPDLSNYEYVIFEFNFGGAVMGTTTMTRVPTDIVQITVIQGATDLWNMQYNSSTKKVTLLCNSQQTLEWAISGGYISLRIFAKPSLLR